MKCKKYRIMMESYIQGELNKGESAALEQHMSACIKCNNQFAALEEIVDTLKRDTAAIRIPEGEKSWQIIQRSLSRKRSFKSSRLALSRRFILAYSLLIFIAGFLVARLWIFPPQPDNSILLTVQNFSYRVHEYFQDLKPIILEFANYSPAGKSRKNLIYHREPVRKLLTQNRMLRIRIPENKFDQLCQLLEELELILTEIVNLDPNNPEDFSMVKELIKVKKATGKLEELYLSKLIKAKL